MVLTSAVTGTLPTAEPTNSTEPTGGVTSPMPRFSIMMMPKWTGSTPTSIATGKKIGVVMTISGAMSIKVPSASSIKLMISRVRIGLSVITPISAPIAAGTSSKCQCETESGSRSDDEQHHGGGAHRFSCGLPHAFPAQAAIDEGADQHGVDHCDGRAFGRGEKAAENAAHDNNRRHRVREWHKRRRARIRANRGIGRSANPRALRRAMQPASA